MRTLAQRSERLRTILKEMGGLLIGFSGGVDSVLLAAVAHDVLGPHAVAVTADSPSLPRRELHAARQVAKEIGIRHIIRATAEVNNPQYAANPANRCYFCKHELFTHMVRLAGELGIRWLAYGENLDDLGDHRPGAEAAAEFGVRAPLKEAGLTKADIRELSRSMGLPTWDKPALACLSSRFPHGVAITTERLAQVEAAEDVLAGLGFRQFRVRYHGEVARIELAPEEMPAALDHAGAISSGLAALGFRFVTLDLAGHRRGSLNPTQADPATPGDKLPVL